MNQSKGQIKGLLSPLLERWRFYKIKKFVVGNHILDYGCCQGKLASNFQEKEYVGVDINKEVIESAKERYSKKNNVNLYTLNEFNIDTYKFDTVILSAVIEHIDNYNQVLIELYERLEDGGIIIITTPTPQAEKILEYGSKIGIFSKEAIEEHRALFTKSDFIDISENLGLNLEHYELFELGFNQLVVFKK